MARSPALVARLFGETIRIRACARRHPKVSAGWNVAARRSLTRRCYELGWGAVLVRALGRLMDRASGRSGHLDGFVIPAAKGAAHGPRIGVGELPGERGGADRSGLAGLYGPALADGVQLVAPGGAVLCELALQSAWADCHLLGHILQRRAARLDRQGQQALEMAVLGDWRRRRQAGGVTVQDAGEAGIRAAHWQIQVTGAEGERGDRRTEVNVAGAKPLGQPSVRRGR